MLNIRKTIAAFCSVLMYVSGSAAVAKYPERPVTLIVPFAPGGPTDIIARIVAKSLESQSGQPFVVENVAGAGSTINTPDEVAQDLQAMIANALKDLSVAQTLRNTGFMADDPRSEALVKRIHSEFERWGHVISEKKITIQ